MENQLFNPSEFLLSLFCGRNLPVNPNSFPITIYNASLGFISSSEKIMSIPTVYTSRFRIKHVIFFSFFVIFFLLGCVQDLIFHFFVAKNVEYSRILDQIFMYDKCFKPHKNGFENVKNSLKFVCTRFC